MLEERMAATSNLQVPTDLRDEPIDLHRIPRPRTEIVERDAHLPRRSDRVAMRSQQVGQLAQYAQYFPELGGLRGAQLVAKLDDLGRLDEDGAARRRLVVHDAAHPRARGAADRTAVTAPAHRDRGIGRALGLIERS